MKILIMLMIGLIVAAAFAGVEKLDDENGTSWAKLSSRSAVYRDAQILTNEQGVVTYRLDRKGLLFNGFSASVIDLGFEADKLISIEFIIADYARAKQELTKLYGPPKVLEAPMKGEIWEGHKVMMSLQQRDKGAGWIGLISTEYYERRLRAAFENIFQ